MAKKSPTPTSPGGTFSKREIAQLEAAKRRGQTRTPSAVLGALFPKANRIGKLTLRQLTLGDFLFLEEIESPLIDSNTEVEEITLRDHLRAVYLLSHPADEVRALHAGGLPKYDEAISRFADTLPADEVFQVGRKLRAALDAAFATVQPMTSSEKKATPATPASAGR